MLLNSFRIYSEKIQKKNWFNICECRGVLFLYIFLLINLLSQNIFRLVNNYGSIMRQIFQRYEKNRKEKEYRRCRDECIKIIFSTAEITITI